MLLDRFALRTVAYLASDTTDLSHRITERLRAARVQAIAARKIVKTHTAIEVSLQGNIASVIWGSENSSRKWSGIACIVSIVVLVIGLVLIHSVQGDNRAQDLADVDVALLTDALPPAAFSDPGFVQFLKFSP